MAKQVLKFAAQDGTEFATEAEADAYDVAQAHAENIDAYVAAAGLEKPQAALLRKHLPQYIAFVEEGVAPAVEVKKERKPRAKKADAQPAE